MNEILKDFSVKLDDTLVTDFRDVVNEGEFAYSYFINRNGRNQFSPICSCMDWISVSIRFIRNFPEISEDIDVKAMQVYSLISSIDIVVEALGQLHRIIMNDRGLKKWPFKGNAHIFTGKVAHFSGKSDDDYFKEIRSIFGAHPTKLKNGDDEWMFASWPHYHAFNGNDFTVSIYSNIPNKNDIIFGIKIDELLAYLEERYAYLIKLKEAVIAIRKKHYKDLSKRIIPTTDNVHDELRVLLSEVAARGDNDYYRMEVGELINLFEGDVKEAHLQNERNIFINNLPPIIEEIRYNLQSMNIEDLTTTEGVIASSFPGGAMSYEIQKLLVWLHSESSDSMGAYYFERLNEYSEGRYNFNVRDSDSTSLLKLRMMLYRYNHVEAPTE